MIEILFWSSIFCSFISAYVLYFKTQEYHKHSGKILSISFILYSWCALGYLAFSIGWMVEIPFFYKTAAPIDLITPPLSYLYVRSVINNESRFKKSDALHFIPGFLFFLNYLPLYGMNYEKKQALIATLIKKDNITDYPDIGFLPEYVHLLVRLSIISIYIFLQWKLIVHFNKNLNKKYEAHTKTVLNWLKTFSMAHSIILVSLILGFGLLAVAPEQFSTEKLIPITSLFVALGYLVLSSFLLLNPQVLFGLPYTKVTAIEGLQKNGKLNEKTYEQEITMLKDYFRSKNPYLKTNLNINEVAIALNIPARELSFMLNQHFNQRFTDFVNAYRVQYVIEQIKQGYCNKYTIETLSKQAGFTSKSTFNAAFKKIMNITPSQYIAKEMSSLI